MIFTRLDTTQLSWNLQQLIRTELKLLSQMNINQHGRIVDGAIKRKVVAGLDGFPTEGVESCEWWTPTTFAFVVPGYGEKQSSEDRLRSSPKLLQ